MKKLATLTVAAALMAMSGAVAYAQSNDAPGKAAQHEGMMDHKGKQTDWKAHRADMQRLMEARIAGIPAGLKLTPEQQKLWAPVETAMKANMKARADFMDKMSEARKTEKEGPDFMARLEARSQMSQMMAQNSKSMLDAMKPFWASLDEGQKKLLPALMMPHSGMRNHMGGMMMGGGMMGGSMMQHGGGMGMMHRGGMMMNHGGDKN